MKDYSGWKERAALVTSLQLDPHNPRIPPAPTLMTQRELTAELVAHDHVYELAQDIAEKGYWPLESLIGFEDPDGKTYILEGNRRLAALKLLINPELAPESHLRRLRNLAASIDTDKLKRVRVLFAPTREAAAPLIMQKHTLSQVERWSPLMQAKFYRGLVRDGVSVEEVAKQHGVPVGEIGKNLRLDTMYAVACAIPLPEDVRATVHNPREFEVSALQRIIETPKAREFLGIEFDQMGRLKGSIDAKEFQKAYARILGDIVKDVVDTRSLNRAADVESYLQKFGEDAPDTNAPGEFTTDDITAPAAEPPPASPPKPAARPAKPKKTARITAVIIPKGVTCGVSNHRIREIFGELRRLRVDDFPNASGILLRVLIDLSVGHYMEKTGKIQPLLAAAKANKKPADWFPTLNQMLNALVADGSIPLSPLAKKKLNKMLSNKDSYISVNLLDGFAHNRYELPAPRELRSLWDTFEGLLAVTLQEPPVPPPPQGSGGKGGATAKPPKK